MTNDAKGFSRLLFGILLPALWFSYSGVFDTISWILFGALSLLVLLGVYTDIDNSWLTPASIAIIIALAAYVTVSVRADQQYVGYGIFMAGGIVVIAKLWNGMGLSKHEPS